MARGSEGFTDWVEPSSTSLPGDERPNSSKPSNSSGKGAALLVAGVALALAAAGFLLVRESEAEEAGDVVATIEFSTDDGGEIIEIRERELNDLADSVLGSPDFREVAFGPDATDEDVRAGALTRLVYRRVIDNELALFGIDPSSIASDETKDLFIEELNDDFAEDADPAAKTARVAEQIDPFLVFISESVARQVRLGDELQAAAEPVEVPCYRHIVLNFSDTELAEDLVAQLNDGADFATLAQEFSTDPSGKYGGNLGCTRPNPNVPEFHDAVLAAEAGEIVGPVETEIGLHIIRVDGIEEQPFAGNPMELAQTAVLDGLSDATIAVPSGSDFVWDDSSQTFLAVNDG